MADRGWGRTGGPGTHGEADPRVVVVVTCLATVAVWMATSAAPVLVPDIGVALGATQSQLQWVVDLFPLTLAALLLPGGSLVDRIGRRRGMLLGLLVMTGGQALSGWAASADLLILGRFVTGVGAALVFPATLATITSVLPEERRANGVAYWAASVILGGFGGLVLAALLEGRAWWGALFVVGAGATVVLTAAVALAIPESADPEHASRDPLGAVLSIAAIGGIVYGITEGPSHGWSSVPVVGSLVLGAACTVLFAVWETQAARPLLDLTVFRDRLVAGASLGLVVVFAADFGVIFTLFQVLPVTRGYDVMDTAITLLPGGALLIPAVLIGARAHLRLGLGPVLALGCAVCACGMAVFAATAHASSGPGSGVASALFFSGIGLVMPATTRSITEALPRSQQGVASALNDVSREVGAAIGIAVLGTLLKVGYQARIDDAGAAVPPALHALVRSSPIAGLAALVPLGRGGAAGATAVRDAVASGWWLASVVAAVGLAILGAVLGVLAGRRRPD